DVSGCPETQGLPRDIGVGVHGEVDQLHRSTLGLELTARIEPIEERHPDVEQNHIRIQTRELLDQRASVGDEPDDVEIRCEHRLEGLEQHQVIVGHQNSSPCHGAPPVPAYWLFTTRSWPETRSRETGSTPRFACEICQS